MNILIVKIGALGDVLRTSFIAQGLKEKYPKSKIFWITGEKATKLFLNNPYVDFLFNEKEKDRIRDYAFDLVINLEEDEETNKFVSSLKAKEIKGFFWKDGKIVPSREAKEWFDMSILGKKPDNDRLKKENKKTHRQIIGEIVGINWKKYEPFLRLTKTQRKIAKIFLRRYNLSRTDLIVGINTGSGDRWPKQLPVKKTAELIDRLYLKYKAKILLFGGFCEQERNKEIFKLAKSPIIDTGCGNDLLEFPALISVCNCFITSDSLGFHIALALKRKTICLIGPTSSSELETFRLGEKIVADSKCICCYKPDCKSMEKIDVKKIMDSFERIIRQKIVLVITAFKEPNIAKAIEASLNQKTRYDYEVVLSAPDVQTLAIAKKYEKDKRFSIMKDPGKGKSWALNMIFEKIKADILILTDGDVYISENSVEDIANLFLVPEIGCVTGRPVPVEKKTEKYGYWANFLFDSAHIWRKKAFENCSFLECSGYLFAFRKNKIDKIPLDVAEDTIIPYFFWEKGYGIGYAENAKVYVKNPTNWGDWMKQKVRTSKAHETLVEYVDTRTTPRVKTFGNEARGIVQVLKYPNSFKEMIWTWELAGARLLMWLKVIYDTKFKNRYYRDGWERIESTK